MPAREHTNDIRKGLGCYRWGDSRATMKKHKGTRYVPLNDDGDLSHPGCVLSPEVEILPGLTCLVAVYEQGPDDRHLTIDYDEEQVDRLQEALSLWGLAAEGIQAAGDTRWSDDEGSRFELRPDDGEVVVFCEPPP